MEQAAETFLAELNDLEAEYRETLSMTCAPYRNAIKAAQEAIREANAALAVERARINGECQDKVLSLAKRHSEGAERPERIAEAARKAMSAMSSIGLHPDAARAYFDSEDANDERALLQAERDKHMSRRHVRFFS